MSIINPTITIKKYNDIIWPIVFIQFLRLVGVNDEITFILMFGYIIFMFINAKKIIIPHIAGIRLYVIFICYAALLGLWLQPMRAMFRDIFYILPTVVVILMGYFCNQIYPKKSLLKTIYVIGAMISLSAILKLLVNPGIINDFSVLRQTIGTEVYETSMVFVAFVIDKFFFGRTIFSRVIDILILFILLAQIVLSFGRTQIVTVAVMLVVALIFSTIYNRQLLRYFGKIAILLLTSIVFIYICIEIMPNDIFNDFSEKWETTNTELDAEQEINSNMDAIQNWRAYEIQCAYNQWKNSSLPVMLFGKGFGQGIKIKYVPVLWKELDITENGAIAILHNGYYTVLIKGGLVGVISMIFVYLSGLYLMFRYIRKYPSINKELIIVASFSVGAAIMGYVINGIFTSHYMFCWGIVFGYVNSRIVDLKNGRDEE